MSKVPTCKKTTPQTRQAEFPNEFKALSENILVCIHCNHDVDWKKKSILIDHLKNSKHLECKLGTVTRKTQETLHQTMSRSDAKNQIIFDFVDMMVRSNIPLEKKIRWIVDF